MMPNHKYAPGDRVTLLPDRMNANARPGVYTIVKTLPVTNQGCQYRAKSALDSHERVLDEVQLRNA